MKPRRERLRGEADGGKVAEIDGAGIVGAILTAILPRSELSSLYENSIIWLTSLGNYGGRGKD